MIKTIIKREFLDNIISFRFMACVLITILLTVISTPILINDYIGRLEDYNKGVSSVQAYLSKIPVYSYLEVGIFKKPSPLSIFVVGIERNIGNHVYLTHREIPSSLKGGAIKNEFSHIFASFDLSWVIIIIFTVLAILLSYESISGEKEDGILALVFSNSIPRYKFLLGKYIGGFVSVFSALTLCFIIGTLIVIFSKGVEISLYFFENLFLLYIFSILYLSSILLIGIFISTVTKTSFNSLILLLAFYLISIFLLPTIAGRYADETKIKKARNYENYIHELKREKDRKIREIRDAIPVKRPWAAMNWEGDKVIFQRINPKETLEFYKRYFLLRENVIKDYAVKIYNLKKEDLRIEEKIRSIQNIFLAFLPSSNFKKSSELIANTGMDNLNRFFHQLTIYWHQLMEYLDKKNAFSLRYFYPYPERFSLEEEVLISKLNKAISQENIDDRLKLTKEAEKYNQGIEYLYLKDMPIFSFYPPGLAEKIKKSFFNISILFLYNLIFFILAHLLFNRYDPRLKL